ncbi:aminobenzoyl-glutamate utilization protein A [Planomicrobium stackebrandtii]|uniref:Aminobenzoyl-glutamate utilization protein A n=1 Tax=Planomicrobium stackebrandtii TaxID=253160 RepID=A0ABU0GRT0_9BACL|nr:amidohydrolase [Planomicrobium stackebrandtii]MDQ0428067.1 aminobenzoyl-glutamate utilization protein A [Planomicrobium stackebrandtii]
MTEKLINEELQIQMVSWRRDLHKHAESGFLEMRTASLVAGRLSRLGYPLKMAEEVMKADQRMGMPSQEILAAHYKWAEANGADLEWLPNFKDGMTGIVAVLETGRPGPTLAYRFDMDALDIQEEMAEGHIPFDQGFQSVNADKMHACAHDGHTSIGLGFAETLMSNKEKLAGTIKLIFQPAEEGTRGAKSMVAAGVVDDVDVFIAMHLGTGVPTGEFVAGNAGFLATTKLDVVFKGVASHAGGKPEEGRNALMAASSAILGLNGIPRHSAGASRINVGVLNAGSGRNIIPATAQMKIETRGETSEINDYIRTQAFAVLEGAAAMYGVEVSTDVVGEAKSSIPSKELVETLHSIAQSSPFFTKTIDWSTDSAGSEDATYYMEHVKAHGGLATYCIVGSDLAAGHHNERFDFDEASMLSAVDVLYRSALKISKA